MPAEMRSRSSLSEAEKAERRKTKKARQRAARAQATAQFAEVRRLYWPLTHRAQSLPEKCPVMMTIHRVAL